MRIKKIIFILIVVPIINLNAKSLSIVLEPSLNISSFSMDLFEESDKSSTIFPSIAIKSEINIHKKFIFVSGLRLYKIAVEVAENINTTVQGEISTDRCSLNATMSDYYLGIPLYIKYSPDNLYNMHFYIGTLPSYLLSSNWKGSSSCGNMEPQKWDKDNTNGVMGDANRIILPITIGIGKNINVLKIPSYVDIQYNFGMNVIDENQPLERKSKEINFSFGIYIK